jgi:hypothetical protein
MPFQIRGVIYAICNIIEAIYLVLRMLLRHVTCNVEDFDHSCHEHTCFIWPSNSSQKEIVGSMIIYLSNAELPHSLAASLSSRYV